MPFQRQVLTRMLENDLMKHLFLLVWNHGFIAVERVYKIKVLMKLMLENVSWAAKFLHNTAEICQPLKNSVRRPVRQTAGEEKAEPKLSLDCHPKWVPTTVPCEGPPAFTSISPTPWNKAPLTKTLTKR